MEQFGERVQNSVFEAWLTAEELRRLMDRLQARMDPQEDSVRIYYLCSACREKTRHSPHGHGNAVSRPPSRLVA